MKRGHNLISFSIFSLILLVMALSLISADTNSSNNSTNSTINNSNTVTTLTGFDKSYACLTGQVNTKGITSLSIEELAFSLMALGYNATMQTALRTELESRKDSANACWPSGACTLKETSLVLLAYDHINKENADIKNWLLNRTGPSSDLVWYLQLDNPSRERAQCTIEYEGSSKSVTINEDKTLTGTPGNCLILANNNYWLEVRSSCYGKEFKITCDKDFITSTIYKKTTSSTIFVSATTNVGSAATSTTEKIESLCFKQGSSCSYEGSLWASFAVHKLGTDIKKFIPYLIASSSDSSNKRLLPSAFLYGVTDFAEYFTELTNEQKTEGYWQTTSDQTKRYYDTAIALYSLYGKSTGQAESAVEYLLKPNVQGNGCWGNSVRDTAFLVYVSSPRAAVRTTNITINPTTSCTSIDFPTYSCVSQTKCSELNGTRLPNFYCLVGGICCNKRESTQSCSQMNGEVCLSSETCTGEYDIASDTSYCCIGGECETNDNPVTNTCESGTNYICRAQQCNSTETVRTSLDCTLQSEVCCAPASSPAPSPGGNYWWIILLVILIILLILAVIFRDQLKVWFFKVKSRFSKQPVAPQNRPYQPSQMPPSRPMPGAMPRRIIPGQMMQPRPGMPPRPFPKDKELEDTLKKLRDMSK